jgi:hypothetical protein
MESSKLRSFPFRYICLGYPLGILYIRDCVVRDSLNLLN